MAAALKVQCGPDWIAQVWRMLGYDTPALDIVDAQGNKRKRKYTLDKARKVQERHTVWIFSTPMHGGCTQIQCRPDWIAQVWRMLAYDTPALDIVDAQENRRKRKYTLEKARKVQEKYMRQQMMSKSGLSNQDASYGTAAAENDITNDELQQLCREYIP